MSEVALITGGTKGLGRALVDRFIEEGWRVATCARNETDIASLANAYSPARLLARAVDIADRDAVNAFVDDAFNAFGPIDVLINNASVIGEMKELVEYSPIVWDATIAINLTGAFNLAQAVAPRMINQREGVIINVSSGAGVKGKRTWGAYAASKFALEGMTQVLRDELLEKHVRVHAFDPGAMQTTMRSTAYPNEDPAQHPTPEQVARVVFDVAVVYEPQLARLTAAEYL